ncbi:hypothetical protein MW7_016970 [Imbroritus primus]|uniref:Uncharacterized protein n=1 Tax=Imbroritus primus TaxID=3058603 RepID=A0ACD3SKM9_9BURK|nr:hypothetical protein MW7_016970 [Burkholderiaceae bacterium PBA]
MSIYGLPSASSPLVSGSVVPDALPIPSTDTAMPLLPVEQTGKPASADWLSTYKPTFNDAQEPASEPEEPATTDGAQEADGGQSDTVESDAVAAVDDGQDAHDGQGGDADPHEGDADGGGQQGSSDTQGDSGGDQQDERGGGERGREQSNEAHRDQASHTCQPAAPADRTALSSGDGSGGVTPGGNRFLSQGPQMERSGTRTPTEWLTDPASGALRAAVVAAGQRIVAEQTVSGRRGGAAGRTHEAAQSDRLTLARRVREAEDFIRQREETTSDGSQEAD